MNIDEAYTWIAQNPFPVPTAGEDRESFMARMSEWQFNASMAHEAIHDERHDRRCFNE